MTADNSQQSVQHVDAELLDFDPIRAKLSALPQVDVPQMRRYRLDFDARAALEDKGVSVSFGQHLVEYVRSIKTAEELKAQKHSATVCEAGSARVQQITCPGVTENELWGTFGAINAALGGDYVETRLLVAGPRTNPWYSEASNRSVQAGEMVGLDTDMIGT